MELAAQNFLNKDIDSIGAIAREVLEGNLREIAGTMKLEDMITNRQLFAEQVKDNAAPDLQKIGLEIKSFNIQEVSDNANVITNLGIDNISQISKKAAIAKAQADKDVATARAEAEAKKAAADATKYAYETEAAAIRAKAEAEAAGTLAKAQAMKEYGDAAKMEMQLKVAEAYVNQIPQVAKALAEGFNKVGNITIYGEDSAGKFVGNMVSSMSQLNDGLSAGMGLDIKGLLNSFVGGKAAGTAIASTLEKAETKTEKAPTPKPKGIYGV